MIIVMASSCHFHFVFAVLVLCTALPVPNSALYAFHEEPQDTAVQRGSTAVLRCSLGHPSNTTTVTWWNNNLGRSISRNRALKRSELDGDQLERYSITGNPSLGEFNLQILNFTDSDAATYKCQIFGASAREGFFRFSRDAELTVAPYDPRCYMDSKSRIPMIGDEVNLVCESRNSEYDGELIWMYAARTFLRGNTTRSPVLRNVVTRVLTPADYDARFMCFEQARTCFLIPLRRFIPVLIPTADAQPRVGDRVTYRCVASKDLTPLSYTWLVNGEDTGIAAEEFTFGPVNASHNGSVVECAVKHYTGFKGNDSVTLHIQPTKTSGTQTSVAETTDLIPPRDTEETMPADTHVSPTVHLSSPHDSVLLNQAETARKNQGDDWDGLLMPLLISALVVGVLLTIIIVLLAVFLTRQRASNRRVTDAAKSQDGARGPPSDCVPLDLVANKDGNIDGSPSISIGTLKGLRNPAGCGSVDTFELDMDPDSPPEYFTLEHDYYYETVVGKPDLINSENQDPGFDGIEVSETITPDSELTARNRKFSFGSCPPPPVPSSPALPQVSMIVPPEFEGNDTQAESLVAAYAITDVARPSPPNATRVIARGGSLKRPLPARPNECGYRTPSVAFTSNEQPFRRFGSLKSLGEPAVGAMARSNSLKRPLPATPKDGSPRVLRTPDPYRNPGSLFIPPFLTSEPPPKDSPLTVHVAPVAKSNSPKKSEKIQKLAAPQKYHRSSVASDRLSAVTSASEGDYAEIDTDQEKTETDSLMSNSSAGGDGTATTACQAATAEGETLSSVDVEDLPVLAANGAATPPGDRALFEGVYDIVADSDGEETHSLEALQKSPSTLTSISGHEPPLENLQDSKISLLRDAPSPEENPEPANESNAGKPMYAKVRKPKTNSLLQPEVETSEANENEFESGPQLRAVDVSPTCESLTDIEDIRQERALLQSAEPPYALVK